MMSYQVFQFEFAPKQTLRQVYMYKEFIWKIPGCPSEELEKIR